MRQKRYTTSTKIMNTPADPNHTPWADRHIWQIKAFRDLLWILAFVGIVSFGYYLRSVFLPVLISLALAYLFNPLINLAEFRLRVPRPVTISGLLLGITLVILGFLAWLAPILVSQTVTLIQKIPAYVQQLPAFDDSYLSESDLINSLPMEEAAGVIPSATEMVNATPVEVTGTIPAPASISPATGFLSSTLGTSWLQVRSKLESVLAEYNIDLDQYENQIGDRIRENMGEILGFTYRSVISIFQGTGNVLGAFTSVFGDVFGNVTYFAVQLCLMPIYFFIFAWHFDPMMRSLKVYIPKSQQDRVIHLVKRMDTAIGNFFRDRIIIAVLLGIFFTVGWGFAGVPFWFLLGMITGILNIVPFASAVGWPIAVILTYLDLQASGETYSTLWFWMYAFVFPTLVFVIGQFLEGWVLVPWLMSQSSDLTVVEVIIVVMVGGSVGGLYGLLLAIPIASCLKIIFTDVVLVELEQWAKKN